MKINKGGIMAKKDITKHKKNEVIYDAKIDGEDSNTINYKVILIAFLFALVAFIMIFR